MNPTTKMVVQLAERHSRAAVTKFWIGLFLWIVLWAGSVAVVLIVSVNAGAPMLDAVGRATMMAGVGALYFGFKLLLFGTMIPIGLVLLGAGSLLVWLV